MQGQSNFRQGLGFKVASAAETFFRGNAKKNRNRHAGISLTDKEHDFFESVKLRGSQGYGSFPACIPILLTLSRYKLAPIAGQVKYLHALGMTYFCVDPYGRPVFCQEYAP